jgi:hypothetical protein
MLKVCVSKEYGKVRIIFTAEIDSLQTGWQQITTGKNIRVYAQGNTETRSDLCILGSSHNVIPIYPGGGGKGHSFLLCSQMYTSCCVTTITVMLSYIYIYTYIHTYIHTHTNAEKIVSDIMICWNTERILSRYFYKAYDSKLIVVSFVFINSFSKKLF